jgi:hypothetical protein
LLKTPADWLPVGRTPSGGRHHLCRLGRQLEPSGNQAPARVMDGACAASCHAAALARSSGSVDSRWSRAACAAGRGGAACHSRLRRLGFATQAMIARALNAERAYYRIWPTFRSLAQGRSLRSRSDSVRFCRDFWCVGEAAGMPLHDPNPALSSLVQRFDDEGDIVVRRIGRAEPEQHLDILREGELG